MTDQTNTDAALALTANLITAYVSNNPVPVSELPGLINQIHQALKSLSETASAAPVEPLKPAVPIKKSVTPDYIISLEDGRRLKSLKRHLATHYGLTPDEYRAKWDLPADYPMVAPNYAAARSALAKKLGLGRKTKIEEPKPAKKVAARRKKA